MAASDFSNPFRDQILRVSYPNGAVSRITNDLNNYSGVSITADGAALATVKSETLSNIWVAAKGDWNHPRQITHGLSNVNGVAGLSWAENGSLVYTSDASGTESLWAVNAENGRARQLGQPRFLLMEASPSACGGSPGYITFEGVSHGHGGWNIWRENPDGSGLKQLTDGVTDMNPSCSADGKWVVFHSVGVRGVVGKVSIDGGKPVQVTSSGSVRTPTISPDGKWIVFVEDENGQYELALVRSAGGKPVKTFPTPSTPQLGGLVSPRAWTPSSRAIDYVVENAGVSNIFQQSIAGGAPVQVTHYDSGHIFWFAISGNGQLALARGSQSSDVVLIKNFQ